MRVLFDQQAFATQRYGGVSRYFVELARALRSQRVHAQIFAPAHLNTYIADDDPLHPLSFHLDKPRRGIRYRPQATAPLLWLALHTARPDILHETAFDALLATPPSGTRRVTTVHDMTVERYPQLFDGASQRVDRKLQALRRADAIICISEHTRQDLLDLYPEFASRCAVVHHGVAHTPTEARRPNVFPAAYLLYVGTRQTYKNFGPLLQALGASARLRADLHLLCFGGGPLSADEIAACVAAGLSPDKVVQIAGNDDLLAGAYRNARAFVFPSLYEGFGMPLTEAMVQGCPIVCSRASSFPEVCEDAAEYFDPADEDSMRAAIEVVVYDEARRAALTDAAALRKNAFTWHNCARQTAQVYADAIARGKSAV